MMGHIAISIKADEKLFQRLAFATPPKSSYIKPPIWLGIAYKKIIIELIFYVFMLQSTLQACNPYKINFWILWIV